MPQPRSVQCREGWLPVRGGFQVTWVAYRNPVLDRALSRFQKDIARRTGLDVGRTGPAQLQVNCRGKDRGLDPDSRSAGLQRSRATSPEDRRSTAFRERCTQTREQE